MVVWTGSWIEIFLHKLPSLSGTASLLGEGVFETEEGKYIGNMLKPGGRFPFPIVPDSHTHADHFTSKANTKDVLVTIKLCCRARKTNEMLLSQRL